MNYFKRLELHSERLTLVAVSRDGYEVKWSKWQDWLIDPEVNRYMMSGLARPTQDNLEKYAQQDLLLRILVERPRRVGLDKGWVGNIRLYQVNQAQRTAELGIMIGEKNAWRKGIAFEACTALLSYAFQKGNLNRVGIGVVELNEAGVALWTKLGFKEEGRLREAFWVDGLPRDVIRMGLLQREWFDAHCGSGTSKTG